MHGRYCAAPPSCSVSVKLHAFAAILVRVIVLLDSVALAQAEEKRIALGIDGHEQRLDVLGGRPDLVERLDDRAERGRALVGAIGIAEIDQQPLAGKPVRGDGLAVGVGKHQRAVERNPPLLGLRGGGDADEQRQGQPSDIAKPSFHT